MVGVPRIARRRRRQVERGAAIGEFVRRQFADQHRAGSGEPGGAGRVLGRDIVLQQLRPAGRRDALGIDDVLEADRDAVQRPRRTARHDQRLGGPRLGQRPLLGDVIKGVQPVIERPDPIEAGLCQFDRRQLFRGDPPGRLGDRGDASITDPPLPGKAVGQRRLGHDAARLSDPFGHRRDAIDDGPEIGFFRVGGVSPARASKNSKASSVIGVGICVFPFPGRTRGRRRALFETTVLSSSGWRDFLEAINTSRHPEERRGNSGGSRTHRAPNSAAASAIPVGRCRRAGQPAQTKRR